MSVKITGFFVFFMVFFFVRINIFANGMQDNNQDKISNHFQELINIGELRPLSFLEVVNNNVFNIVIEHLSKSDHRRNDNIDDYYFSFNTNIILTIEEYNDIMNFQEYSDSDIEYHIYYYKILFNRYSSYRGDPTGKCFTIQLNKDNEFLRIIGWR